MEAAPPPSAHPASGSFVWVLSFSFLDSVSLWLLSSALGDKPLLVLLSARGRPPRRPASLRRVEMRSRCSASRLRSASTSANSICSRPVSVPASPVAAYFHSALANRPASVSDSRPSASPQSTFALNQMSIVQPRLPVRSVAFSVTKTSRRAVAFRLICSAIFRFPLFNVAVLVTSRAYHNLPVPVNLSVTKLRKPMYKR